MVIILCSTELGCHTLIQYKTLKLTKLNFLSRPWPLPEPHENDGKLSIFIGAIVYFILTVLQPFDIDKSIASYLELKLFGYAFITSIWIYIAENRWSVYIQSFLGIKPWTIGKSLISTFFVLSIIGICYGLYTLIVFPDGPVAPSFLECILYTYFLGVIITTIILGWQYIKYLQRRTSISSNALHNPIGFEKRIKLIGNQSIDDIEVLPSKIILISALGNYVTVYYESDDGLKKCVLRQTLKSFNKMLPKSRFVRCHRSHIVNLNRISSFRGTVKNFKVKMELISEEIQVSRRYVNYLKSFLNDVKSQKIS